ncbi:MAG: tetratricopeptide repeat protein [Candidatus Kariarchaeaceae archaeon]
MKIKNKGLAEITQLMASYHYDTALEKIEVLEQEENPPQEIIMLLLLKAKAYEEIGLHKLSVETGEKALKAAKKEKTSVFTIKVITALIDPLTRMGKHDAALENLEELKKLLVKHELEYGEESNTSLTFKALILNKKALYYQRTLQIDNALKCYYEARDIYLKLNNKSELMFTLKEIGSAYSLLGQYDKTIEKYEEFRALAEELGDEKAIANYLNNMGGMFWIKGDLDKALDYFQKSYEIKKKIGLKNEFAYSLLNIGLVYRTQRKFDLALIHFERALANLKELSGKLEVATFYSNIGHVYKDKGDLDQALQYYTLAVKEREEYGHTFAIALSYLDIGNVFRVRGDLDQALNYFEKSLPAFKEIKRKDYVATCIGDIGLIYHAKGDFSKAVAFLQESLSIWESMENDIWYSEWLFNLIKVLTDGKKTEEAEKILEELKIINENEKLAIIGQRTELATALILKTNKRAKEKVKAEAIFEKIINEEILDSELIVLALLNLSELFLEELKLTSNVQLIEEIDTLLEQLFEIAVDQNNFALKAETYWLQAKVALINLELNKAREFLTLAQLTAEEKGLERLAIQISEEHDKLLSQFAMWNEFIDSKTSLNKRIEPVHAEELLIRMIQNGELVIPELENEEPLLLLILSKNGSPIFTKKFFSGSIDEVMIGGFMAAVNSFLSEVFGLTGFVDRLKFEDNTIIFKMVESIVFCYVVKGPSYKALKKLDNFVARLQKVSDLWKMVESYNSQNKIITLPIEEMERIIEEEF